MTHSVLDLFRQRVCSAIAGYEDLDDAQRLRGDPPLGLTLDNRPSNLTPEVEQRASHPAGVA